MPTGICALCKAYRELQLSHIWSSFGYKRYVANQKRGGAFLDLPKQKSHNKQVKDYLLCAECEQRLSRNETGAAGFLDQVAKSPASAHNYDLSLHDFAVSISWRAALYLGADMELACDQWRRYLLGKRGDVGAFTQHAFIAFGQDIPGRDVEWHKSLGGQVFVKERFVLSRMGPLLIVGHFEKTHLLTAAQIAQRLLP